MKMTKVNIDLGEKPGSPEVAGPTSPSKPYYPSFSYTSDKESSLPDEGTMLVKFQKVDESKSTTNGKTRYSCRFEVQEIVSVSDSEEGPGESGGASSPHKDTEDALDNLRSKAIAKKKKEADTEGY